MAGEEYELTPELVRAKLRGREPEPVRQYSVEIDGAHWPVKQVMRIATGARPSNSSAAREVLQRLGFVIQGAPVPRAVGNRGTPPVPRTPFDLAALEVVDAVDASVSFNWHHAGQLTLDTGGKPHFPPLPDLPGLYRYDFGMDEQGVRTVYIGESQSLRKRARNYRIGNPRQQTSHRINNEVVAHLSAGGTIEFAITTLVTINCVSAELRLTSARRAAEHNAVLLAQTAPNIRVLNIDVDLGGEAAEPPDVAD